MNPELEERILALRRQIQALTARFPAHSIPPALMAELDELEAQLQAALVEQQDQSDAG